MAEGVEWMQGEQNQNKKGCLKLLGNQLSFTQGLTNTSQISMYIPLSISPLYKVHFVPELHLKYSTLFFKLRWERAKKNHEQK